MAVPNSRVYGKQPSRKADINQPRPRFFSGRPSALFRSLAAHVRPPPSFSVHTSLLVLTDFNPAAHRALMYANSLAGAIDAHLVLLHVRRDSLLDPALFTGQLSHRSQRAVDTALARAVRDLTVPVVTETGHGQIAAAVADALTHHPSALIVLGRPDEESIPDELITAAALDLLRADPHTMLIVPHEAPATNPPHRVLLAIDAEPFTLAESNEVVRHFLAACTPD